MRTIDVELMAFGQGQIRPVELPDGVDISLDNVFIHGQNYSGNAHLNMPSVSVGDIIHMDNGVFVVKGFGFEEIDTEIYDLLKSCLRSDKRYSEALFEVMGPEAADYA